MPEFESVKKSNKKNKKKQTFSQSLFPCKNDSTGEIIRKIVFLAAILVLIGATVSIVYFYFIRSDAIENEQEKLNDLRGDKSNDIISIEINVTDANGEEVKVQRKVLEEYAKFCEQNSDMVGYVEIYPHVRTPVVQGEDNEFYLKHNFNKQPTENGTVFADYEVPITADSIPANTIIYGHNLITKNMFEPLSQYRKNGIDFLKENYRINYDTIYKKNQYLIFAVFLANFDPTRGDVFNYQNYVSFSNKSEFDNFVAECLDRSYYYTGIDIEYGDELLTLSTCDFAYFRYDMRLVVVARKVRDDESPVLDPETFIDNSGFDENGNLKRKMFKDFYSIYAYNCEWGGRKWDTSWIKDFEG